MPIAWQSTFRKPSSPSPWPVSHTKMVATMVISVVQIAILTFVLLGALELQHVVGAAPYHAVALCSCPARGSAAELPACCCFSFVVVGDAFQDSSSKKYCERWLAWHDRELLKRIEDLRSFPRPFAPRP